MSGRDLAVVSFRCVAVWLGVSGIVGVLSVLMSWDQTVAQLGGTPARVALAASALYLPVAAVLWMAAVPLASRALPGPAPSSAPLTRNDLFTFGVFGIGLYLIAEAVPTLVHWIVVLRSTREESFLSDVAGWQDDNGVVYSVTFKADLAATVMRLVLGVLCLAGPKRVSNWLGAAREELLGTTLGDPPDGETGAKEEQA